MAILLQQLAQLPATVSSRRPQFAFPLLHETGLRLAELLAATTGDLRWEALSRPGMALLEGWWLTVRGKGDRFRQVPVWPDSLVRLEDYVRARGLSAGRSSQRDRPLNIVAVTNWPGHRRRVPINCETGRTISPLTVRIQSNYLETQSLTC
ncbi:hypothetical protein ACIP1U_32185 [Cupriavidus sp. NPDC089707]|uniref:hypothetical protein n=1 Tax=Cupriavidus sp. NPDC089707 TaxID=3363963 RepID=UPI00382CEBF2